MTLDGVVVGYGIGPASMQTMADLLEGQSEDVMLAVGQRVTWNMKLSRLRECAASRRVAQDYGCRLWARVKAAAGPTSDIEVYFDQELGPKDASSVAWAYITSDLVLGFPRQPELVSGKHHMK